MSGRSAIAWNLWRKRSIQHQRGGRLKRNQDKKDWRRYTRRRVLGMGNKVMFTGIIEDTGKVSKIEHRGQEERLILELPPHLTEVQLGDRININGVCLTIVQKNDQRIELDLSMETLEKTALRELKEGDHVNLA